jgi:hypothetical protein
MPPPPPPNQGPFGSPGTPGPPQYQMTPTGFTPYATASAAPVRRANGLWIAAGVMQLIEAALLIIGGFGLLAFSSDEDTNLFGFDELFTVFAVILLAVGAAALVGGIGCAMSRTWGAIVALVVHGLFLVLLLFGLADGGDSDGAIVPLLWMGTIVLLCALGMRKRR